MIEKLLKSKYILKSKKGKKLGEFKSKKDAIKREKQINFFKALEREKNEKGNK